MQSTFVLHSGTQRVACAGESDVSHIRIVIQGLPVEATRGSIGCDFHWACHCPKNEILFQPVKFGIDGMSNKEVTTMAFLLAQYKILLHCHLMC